MADFRGWRPIQDTHAIQSCHLTVQFGEPAGEVLWRRIDAVAGAHAGALGLADRQKMSTLPFLIPIQIPGLVIEGTPEGVVHSRSDPNGTVAERLHLNRDAVKYEQLLYTRWAPFRDRVERLMREPVEMMAAVSSLSSVTSSYVDVFEFAGQGQMSASDVVDIESPLVASGAVHDSTLWHSHCGYYEYPDAITRRLVQINVDTLSGPQPDGVGRVIRITTQIADQFGQPESDQVGPDGVTWSFLLEHADDQHARLKSLLVSVLTNEAAQSISAV